MTGMSSKIASQVDRRVFNLYRERHPTEFAEAWPVCILLVNTCWKNLTPNSRHTRARAVLRSAVRTETPERYEALRAEALEQTLLDPRYREAA